MKRISRILPLVAIVITAVVAFSGCGKILEAFFPEETGTGDNSGANAVTVIVKMSTDAVKDFQNETVVVRLQSTDKNKDPKVRSGVPFLPEGEKDAVVEIRFEFLPDDGYRLEAWLDTDSNREPSPDEPFGASAGAFFVPDKSGAREVGIELRIFPAAGTGSNRVSVTARPNIAIVDYTAGDGWIMELFRADAPLQDPFKRATARFDDGSYGLVEFVYDGLPNGFYTATVWFDKNYNTFWDEDEAGKVVASNFELPPDLTVSQKIEPAAVVDPGTPRVYLSGPQVFAVGEGMPQYYELRILQANPTVFVQSFQYRIWGNYYEQTGTIFGGGDLIYFDTGNFVYDGDYSLEVYNVLMTNGKYSNNQSLPIYFIIEPTYGSVYYPHFSAYNFGGVHDLYASYNVRVEFYNYYGENPNWYYGNVQEWYGALYSGYFEGLVPWAIGNSGNGSISYSGYYWGLDWAVLSVDTDWNGSYTDPGDLVAMVQLGVSSYDPYDLGSGAYQPSYNVPAERFLKVSEFNLLYP